MALHSGNHAYITDISDNYKVARKIERNHQRKERVFDENLHEREVNVFDYS